jgi:hypothetical protein
MPLSVRQLQVLEAAVDLVNGGLDMEEALMCYRTISEYVINTRLIEDPDSMDAKSAITKLLAELRDLFD